ncbi:MAG: VWA domain-containing protein [Flavobacteriales bacterium]|nr:VWA domain-containing protein [Flavobacteriales bacterium]
MSTIKTPSSDSPNPKQAQGFRVFSTAVSLALAEVIFWIAILSGWYSLRQVAPNVQIEHSDWWPILLLVPVVFGVFVWSLNRKQRLARMLADEQLWPTILPHWRPQLHGWKFFVWRLAFAAVLIGILDIKVGARLKEVKSEGVDVMVALDVSKSMEAEDLGASRLAVAKRSIERLIDQLDGDRIGLVIFGGDAFVQCPITTDYGAAKLFLQGVNTGAIPVQGTAIGRAIEVCSSGFSESSPASKMIVLFTDGESHEDDAVKAATTAAEAGIEVHTIGMGSASGAPIPLYDRYGRPSGFKNDADGNPIVTTLDEATLIETARAGNGSYIQAAGGLVNISPILQAMNGMEQAEVATMSYTDYTHHFHWFFIFAVAMLLLEGLMSSDLLRRRLTTNP